MVGFNTDGPARDRVIRLMAEKDRIENEIREQSMILASNNVGMHDSLVDDQGYPRADIDVYKVRLARHVIICLQNDHKAIMKHIEDGLVEVHAELMPGNRAQGSSSGTPSQSSGHAPNGHTQIPNGHTQIPNGHTQISNGHTQFNNRDMNSGDDLMSFGANDEGFAIITFVHDGSPADMAGLCVQDEILQFGSVNKNNFTDIIQVHNVVAHSVGQSIQVLVKRNNSVLNLRVIPRPWGQSGLLGCQINRRLN